MSIFLIRHGETALNVARVLQPADTPLSLLGQRQAGALAGRLARMNLAGIVSSDLARAWRTAQAVAAATGLAVVPSPLLHERNFGELRGRPYDVPGFDPLAMTAAPAGGESAAAFADRVAKAFAMIVRMRAALAGPLAVVTHGLVIRAMLEAHVGLRTEGGLPPRIGNTSLTIFSALPPHEIALLDCTSHLAGDARDNERGLSGG